MDKKAELELKKAKLEQMRKKKAATTAAANESSSPNTSQTHVSIETSSTSNIDPDKILIECGITTPVLMSSMPSSSSLMSSVDDPTSLQHLSIPGQSRNLFKR